MIKKPRKRRIFGVRRRPGKPTQGIVNVEGRTFPCALGRGGTSWRKREGDGATPIARMKVLGGYVRRDGLIAPGRSGIALRSIGPGDGWCDAPGDRNYNRPVRLPYPASHERLRRDDDLYDICVVLDWNIRPRMRNRGSAIFLHLARPGHRPTEGCIALSVREMTRMLPLIGGAEFRIVG